MKATHELYSVSFNRHVDSKGNLQMYLYTLGVPSQNLGRIPEKITLRGDRVTIEFTDGAKHIIPYGTDVELFERLIEPKTKKDGI